jgi:hypothetical protein
MFTSPHIEKASRDNDGPTEHDHQSSRRVSSALKPLRGLWFFTDDVSDIPATELDLIVRWL